MKESLKDIVRESVKNLYFEDSADIPVTDIEISIPKKREFGDYSSNIAMVLTKPLKKKPRDIAEQLSENLSTSHTELFKKVEIAGPGFLNFFVNESSLMSELEVIEEQGNKFGQVDIGEGRKIIVEFVSANPTGFLHLGHARNAVVGDGISNILKACGYDVTKEFYINDAGRQIDMLGVSVLCKYKEIFGTEAQLPEDGYKGSYITDIANEIKEQLGDKLLKDESEQSALDYCRNFAKDRLLQDIKDDLGKAGIYFDNWFSEKEGLHGENESNRISQIKKQLQKNNALENKDGALWFKATEYGEQQDWVLIKSDGSPTYFIADIAYHNEKIERGFDRLINIWGADHHSHISRLKAAIQALGYDKNILDVPLIQFVRLVSEGKEVKMSKRSGEYVTMREVLEEVGPDVLRFFMLMRSSDSHLDFDLDLAKRQSSENPVYYVQYAHARINSVFQKAGEADLELSKDHINLLDKAEEVEIAKTLLNFPEVIKESVHSLSPHKITFYLQELASQFHVYYNKYKIVTDDDKLSSARLYLISCVKTVI
nr:arginine--tRNA ligase [Candidatus Dadabacteria bacterium]NIS07485.1 arginine--tRNA ligase [Candidatus Dadabacteria bacterium]NIV41791.1 arginine--tRNA ligase [Candidatus Dadabacteria bacterium]NIY21124.1 arginine--tRNA ligase [Candidatus Dadabacteria bacterium]